MGLVVVSHRGHTHKMVLKDLQMPFLFSSVMYLFLDSRGWWLCPLRDTPRNLLEGLQKLQLFEQCNAL